MTRPLAIEAFVAAVILAHTGVPVFGASAPRAAIASSPDAHVRCDGEAACALLARAVLVSPTTAAMVDAFEATDVIVIVQTSQLPTFLHGDVQVVAATPTVRYLRIRLKVPDTTSALIAVLGHELQHALEIAAMADVRDGATLAQAYQRRGASTMKGGYYETAAAIDAGRIVAGEVMAARGRRPDAPVAAVSRR